MSQPFNRQTEEEKKRRRKLFWWWFSGIFSALLLISVIAIVITQDSDPSPVIRVFENEVILNEGESEFIDVSTFGDTGALTYESLDESVVRFEASTLIAVGPGITTVRVRNDESTAFDEFNVTVNSPERITVTIGDEVFTFNASVSVNDLDVLVPEGNILEGLYLDAALEIPLEGDLITQSITLYPKFIPSVERLTLTVLDINEAPLGTIRINRGDALGSVVLNTAEGDYFVRSLDTCEDSLTDTFVFESDMTLYQLRSSDVFCEPLTELTVEGSLKSGTTATAIVGPVDEAAQIIWRLDGDPIGEGPSIVIPEDAGGQTLTAEAEALHPYTGSLSESFTVNEKTITLTLENDTGEVIETFTLDAGDVFDTTQLPATPSDFKGYFLNGETCEAGPFDFSSALDNDITLVQGVANDLAPCITLEEMIIVGDANVGETLHVAIDPKNATAEYDWFISADNRDFTLMEHVTGASYKIPPTQFRMYIAVNVRGVGDTEGLLKGGTSRIGLGSQTVSAPEAPFIIDYPEFDPNAATRTFTDLQQARIIDLTGQGYIPIATIQDFESIDSGELRVFAANSAVEIVTTGGVHKNYILINDIDFSGKTYTDSVVRDIEGILDGNDHTLKNVTVNASTRLPAGLFMFAGADDTIIRNLTLENFDIRNDGAGYTAALVGTQVLRSNLTIESVNVVDGTVDGTGSSAGLVGYLNRFTQLNVSQVSITGEIHGNLAAGGVIGHLNGPASLNEIANHARISSDQVAGGMIGKMNDVTVLVHLLNVYNTGVIQATNNGPSSEDGPPIAIAGGLIGSVFSNNPISLTVNQAYNGGLIDATTAISSSNAKEGAIFGSFYAPNSITMSGVQYLTASGINAFGEIFQAPTETPQSLDNISITAISAFTPAGFDMALGSTVTTWAISYEGQRSYPWLSFEKTPDPRLIIKPLLDAGYLPVHSVEDLLNIMNDVDQDLTFAGGSEYQIFNIDGTPLVTSGGLDKKYVLTRDLDLSSLNATQSVILGDFAGTFDGAGNALLNLSINSTGSSVGLFESISGASMQNLTLENFNISGTTQVAALAGNITGSGNAVQSIILNQVTVSGVSEVGGLAGSLNNATLHVTQVSIDGQISSSSDKLGGLLGSIDASSVTVSGIHTTSELTGSRYIGGIVGFITESQSSLSIDQSSNTGPINVTNSVATQNFIGGLLGGTFDENYVDVTISESFNAGILTVVNEQDFTGGMNKDSGGAVQIGGLIGRSGKTVIINDSFNAGTIDYSEVENITSPNFYVGGLIGNPRKTTTVEDSYNIGGLINQISDNNSTPGALLGGYFSGETYTVTNVFYDSSIQGNTQSVGRATDTEGTDSSSIQMTGFEYHDNATWDVAKDTSNTWAIGYQGDMTYPWLSWMEAPLESQRVSVLTVSDQEAFSQINDHLDGNYRLGGDVDLSTGTAIDDAFINGVFTGDLDGQGFTVSGLSISASSKDNIGLFSQVSGASIKDITIENFNVTGKDESGILIGEIINLGTVTIEDILITNSQLTGSLDIGAVVGKVDDKDGLLIIRNVINYANITATKTDSWAGGFIGRGFFNLIIENSENKGTVSGNNIVGGIIGEYGQKSLTMSGVTNHGEVSGDQAVAGIIARFYTDTDEFNAHLDDLKNHATVSGITNVGGFFGEHQSASEAKTFRYQISNSINSGLIEATTSSVAGIFGNLSYDQSETVLTISAIANKGNISASGATGVGGLIGHTNKGSLTLVDIYNDGDITGAATTGGLVGKIGSNLSNLLITRAYNYGSISGNALIGLTDKDVTFAGGVFYLDDNSTAVTTGSSVTLTGSTHATNAAAFESLTTFENAGWDISLFESDALWVLQPNEDKPRFIFEEGSELSEEFRRQIEFTEDGYIPISSVKDFEMINSNDSDYIFAAGTVFEGTYAPEPGSQYLILNDIDFTGAGVYDTYIVQETSLNTIEGNNKTLRNITIDQLGGKSLTVSTGIFSVMKNTNVRNLNFDSLVINGGQVGTGSLMGDDKGLNVVENLNFINVNVTGLKDVGGVAGRILGSRGSTYQDIFLSGNIASTFIQGGARRFVFVGGLIGSANSYFRTGQYTDITIRATIESPEGGAIGGFFGQLQNGDLTNASFAGNIDVKYQGTSINLGGTTGFSNGSNNYLNVGVRSDITLTQQTPDLPSYAINVGGFIGQSAGGVKSIENAYYNGDIDINLDIDTTPGRHNAGLFIGIGVAFRESDSISLEKVYVNGTLTDNGLNFATGEFFGQLGTVSIVDVTGEDNYAIDLSYVNIIGSTEQDTSGVTIENKTLNDLQDLATYTDWNFSNVWDIDSNLNDGVPFLQFENDLAVRRIPIATVEDFLAMQSENIRIFGKGTPDAALASGGLDKSYYLVEDIDFFGTNFGAAYTKALIDDLFTGILDGNGYTLSNIDINAPAGDPTGLFNELDGATIQNITLDAINVTGNDFVGVLAGQARGATTISNVSLTSTVNVYGADYVGGLLGENNGHLTISAVTNTGDITADTYGGGFVGHIEDTANGAILITNSNVDITLAGRNHLGGFIGRVQDYATLTVAHSTSAGLVDATQFDNGGLFGEIDGGVATFNYVTNLSTVDSDGVQIGGFIGDSDATLTISNSSNQGSITGDDYVGGLLGEHNGHLTLSAVTNTGNITTETYGGGLVGRIEETANGAILISQASVNMTLSGFNHLGGFIGRVEDYATLTVAHSTSAGLVDATEFDNGGLFGEIDGGVATFNYVTNLTNVDSDGVQIAGFIGDSDATLSISNSSNQGSITGDDYTSGLIGEHKGGDITLTNTYNTGTIDGDDYVAGLIGNVRAGLTVVLIASENRGNITALDDYAGGFIGRNGATLSLTNTTNSGIIEGIDKVGGFIGENNDTVVISSSVNTGEINGRDRVGGIIGTSEDDTTILNVYNTGTINGEDRIGGIIGRIQRGRFILEKTYNQGAVNSSSSSNDKELNAGGIIGYHSSYSGESYTFTLDEVFNTGAISVDSTGTGQTAAGGIIGYLSRDKLTIENSYNTGDITSETNATSKNAFAGGLIGLRAKSDEHTITNAYNIGSVTGSSLELNDDRIGGLVGSLLFDTDLTVTNSYYLNTSAGSAFGDTNISDTHARNQNQMLDANTYDNWEISAGGIWRINSALNSGYPFLNFASDKAFASEITALIDQLQSDGYTVITSAAALAEIVDNLAAKYALVGDVDLTSETPLTESFIDDTFTGEFDGNGFIIKGLSITTSDNKTGFFKNLEGATITNLTLDSFEMEGQESVGGLAGGIIGTPVTRIEKVQTLSGSIEGSSSYVGGLIGFVENSNLIMNQVENQFNVTKMAGINVGGIIGRTEGASVTLTGIVNRGDISGLRANAGIIGENHSTNTYMFDAVNYGAINGSDPDSDTGGLIGLVYSNSTARLINVTNYGQLTTSGREIGGLIGQIKAGTNYVTIENAMNYGNILSTGTNESGAGGIIGEAVSGSVTLSAVGNEGNIDAADLTGVGGLIGIKIDSIIHATNVYNAGTITGGTLIGGLFGDIQDTVTDVTVVRAHNYASVNGNALIGQISGTALTVTGGVFYLDTTNTSLTAIGTVTITGDAESIDATAFSDISTFTDEGWDMGTSTTGTIWKLAESDAWPSLNSYEFARTLIFDPSSITDPNNIPGTSNNGVTITNGEFIFVGSSNHYIDLGQPLEAGSSYTKEAWVYDEGSSGSRNILSSREHVFYVKDATTLEVGYRDINGFNDDTDALTGTLPAENWTHILVTYDAATGELTLYIDGVQESQANNVPGISKQNIAIGTTYEADTTTATTSTWDGKMGIVRLYARALSAEEVMDNYNATRSIYE